jgi:uncharacterized protein
MSDAKAQQHEPSMEEILASIRRIIAEDGDTTAPAGAAPPADADNSPTLAAAPAKLPGPGLQATGAGEDILELTEVVEPDGSVVSLNAMPKPEPEPARPEPAPAAAPPVDERIVSAATAAASVAALSQIASLSSRPESRERDLALGAGHLTLETLVREELRPILKDWLDQHLPDMVERLVQEEITRLVRDVQRR